MTRTCRSLTCIVAAVLLGALTVVVPVATAGGSALSVAWAATGTAGDCSAGAQHYTEAPTGDPNGYYNATYGPSYYAGRSFTALGGTISSVSTWMYRGSDKPLVFTVIEGTDIHGTVVGTATSPSAGGTGQVTATFATPLVVTPGMTYILKINSPTATSGIAFAGPTNGDTGYYNGGTGDGKSTSAAPAVDIGFCDSTTTCDSPASYTQAPTGDPNNYYNATYGPTYYAGRSFRALGSEITTVSTWMYQASDKPLTFTILQGGIHGTVLGTAISPTAGGTGRVTATFSPSVSVTPGATYILKINSPAATSGITFAGPTNGDTGYYNGGTGDGSTTNLTPAVDLAFCGVPETTVTYPPTADDFHDVHGSAIAGESFQAADGSLDSATIYLTAANDGPLSISVRHNDMSGRVVGSAALPAGATGPRTVTFSPAVPLSKDDTYVLTVAAAQLENHSGTVAQQAPNPDLQGYTEAGPVDTDMAMTLVFGAPVPNQPISADSCPVVPKLTSDYIHSVEAALAAKTDVWGNAAKSAPDGPTLANVSGHLHPLRTVGSPAGTSGNQLTDSGVYYLPFGVPGGTFDSARALHVADGSQVVSTSATGRKMTVLVGADGTERYGLCASSLTDPTLLDGYQPVLETGYTDLDGASYTQESFAAYLPGTQQLASFVKLTATGTSATKISLALSDTGLSASNGVVTGSSGAVLYYSGAATLSGSTLTYNLDLGDGDPHTIYLVRPVAPAAAVEFTPDAATHTAARGTVTAGWDGKLAQGATYDVPERAVMDAQKNLLIQNLALRWRYSVGNAYEDWFPSESGDALSTLAQYGYGADARSGLQYILNQTIRSAYPNWDRGARMGLSAQYYELTKDSAFIDQNTPLFETFMDAMQSAIAADPNGLLPPEAEGGDIPTKMYGTHSQTIAWRGMTDILRVWRETGHVSLADRYQPMLDTFTTTLKAAVASSSVRVDTDQLFVPPALLRGDQPYDSVTESKDSSYWDLENPYVLASGILTHQQLQQAWNYAANHGATMLGLQRFNYYPTPDGSATAGGLPGYATDGDDTVYAVSRVKALADLDDPDELVLDLYGKLAAGMTPNTFIAGEGHSIDPADGNYYRSMYLPPDLSNNDMFLTTLHEMLVHVVDGGSSEAPSGLQLAYATPRNWLDDGKQIAVTAAPTPFGDVSYSITSALATGEIDVSADVPAAAALTSTSLRLRLPGGNTLAAAKLSTGEQLPVTDGQDIDLTGLTGEIHIVATVESPLQAASVTTVYGQDAALSASYAPAGATGQVTFALDGSTLCSADLDDHGVATCPAGAELAQGTYLIAVHYAGDAHHDPASTTLSLAVLPPAWAATRVYLAGAQVSYQGEVWQALWWTQNQTPGNPYGPWEQLATAADGTALWTPSRVFNTGDVVSYQGAKYRAKWWTRNQAPGDPDGPWQPITTQDENGSARTRTAITG